MSAFTVFHPAVYCVTTGSASWAPTPSPFLWGQWVLTQTEDPHSGIPPFRKEGGKRIRGGGWKKITDRRQVTVYIQVRPTFYQSKTIHSICMQKLWGWMHLKAESDLSALLREIHTGEATGKLWDWVKTRCYKWRPYQRAAILVSLLQAWFFLFFYFFKHQCFEHRGFFLG